MKKGNLYSESSTYLVEEVNKKEVTLNHLESGELVKCDIQYINDLMKSADNFIREVKVGKQDKFDGSNLKLKGIKTIWQEIQNKQVFTVGFKKQNVELSKSKIEKLKQEQIQSVLDKLIKAKEQKKGILEVAKQELINLQNNPILDHEEGELRVLRGYKTQFHSEDGRFKCFDVDIKEIRLVNINTISFLIFDNTKFIVQ